MTTYKTGTDKIEPSRPVDSPAESTPPGTVRLSVLVADDDRGVLTVLSRLLHSHGFLVFTCRNGRDAIQLFRQLKPTLVLVEIKLPEMDGLTVCQRLRSESDVPIIVVTILTDEGDAADALDAGADDYVRKPFGTNELMARVRAVLRRAGVEAHRPERLVAGPLVVDERQHVILIDGAKVVLSRTEFRLLAYLVRNQDRVLTHDYIIAQAWGAGYVGSHHVLRVTMSRLRKKLGPAGRSLIETLPGVGYRFRFSVAFKSDEPALADRLSTPGTESGTRPRPKP